MTSYFWLSIVSIIGSLILVGSGLRARKVETRKMLLMAGAWAAIFVVVAFVVANAGG